MSNTNRFLILLTAATAFFGLPPQAAANSRSAMPFDIPAQPLSSALAEYSRQSGVRVEYNSASTAGLLSRDVRGDYPAGEALALLLEGTGLVPRFETPTVAVVGPSETRVYSLPALTAVAVRGRGYGTTRTISATRTDTPIRDTPQSVSIVMRDVIADQSMQSMADVVRYIPGITMGQGEGHRDAPTIRGNSTTADFFVDGVRDDVQYYRDLYNVERVEALKGSNAMVFGRGGGGGVLNRVTKEAQWAPVRVLTAETGSFDHRRSAIDVGRPFGDVFAARFNGMYENSGGFRDAAKLERFGLNPTLAFSLGNATTLRSGYEYFSENRTVDRGIPSFQGRPSGADITTFFGNPDSSYATARIHSGSTLIELAAGRGITLRNRTRVAHYDKFYQNSLPGALNATGTQVTLTAYSNETNRNNVFNQTDLILERATGRVKHTLLVGAELGRQDTKNFRNTGYYNNTVTSFTASFEDPTVSTPITFRQSATDTDSRTIANVAAAYVQDQIVLSEKWLAIGGVRFERFGLQFENNRNGDVLENTDNLIGPRAGLVFKPIPTASFYASYGVAYLPSSGDQFGSLTVTSQALEPEQFQNYEVGAKWDVRPSFALTTALYSLDRTNTTSPDPLNSTRLVQTGSQRTRGVELGASGSLTKAWQLIAGASFQDARITSKTTAADAGAKVALVPARTFSLWNRYQALQWLGIGIGVVQQAEMYAAVDNTVTLPGFTRADAALFLRIGSYAGLQLNMENVLDERYYITSHGNNNIMPGASRTLRLTLTTRD